MVIERFAPSPTGLLHLGHAYSAWCGWTAARQAGGAFRLRMEDLDSARVRPAFYEAIEDDLGWLGLDWDGPVLSQSQRIEAYEAALSRLAGRGLTYPCTCKRRDIAEAISAPQAGAPPPHGPDGLVYPGTCRGKPPSEGPHAIRLDMARAVAALGGPKGIAQLGWHEIGLTPGRRVLDATALIADVGDVVLVRRDGATAYHLAVVVDDAHQGVTHVTRGEDLAPATQIHRVLQALLDLAVPVYRHHRLVTDETGKRLAKRDDARAIAAYRAAGLTPAKVLARAGVSAAIPGAAR